MMKKFMFRLGLTVPPLVVILLIVVLGIIISGPLKVILPATGAMEEELKQLHKDGIIKDSEIQTVYSDAKLTIFEYEIVKDWIKGREKLKEFDL